MKRVILSLLFFGLFLTACEDTLDLKPNNALETELALQQPSDFTNAIRGVYSRLTVAAYWGGWYEIVPDVLSDNLIIGSEGRNSKQSLHYWTHSGNDTWGGLWDNGYTVVYRCNAILENIDKLSDGDFKNNIMGEALALRAMAHFDMARVFSKLPQDATGGDQGIPYVTTTDVTLQPSRPSVQETYDNILADLNQAATVINDDNGVGRIDKVAVYALLARYYLYLEQWQNSVDAATNAINLGNGMVASLDAFPAIWKDATEEGVIFKVSFTDDDPSLGVEYSQTGPDGVRSEYVVDYGLYQLYTDTDIRKDAYFSTSVFAGKEFNHIAKYFGRETGDVNLVDAKVIRWAEVFLTRAEAYANLGQDAEALADLDELRAERYTNFTSGNETGQALKDAIMLQRRLELAFEGHRFFDLKRKDMAVTRSNFGDESTGGGTTLPANAITLPAGDPRFQLPIPQPELNANPNMTQNPGY